LEVSANELNNRLPGNPNNPIVSFDHSRGVGEKGGDWRKTRERKSRKPEKRKRASKEENGDPENAVE
jgi:hypothetical protein